MSVAETMLRKLRIDARHPSLPGHFPGQPVVPGVVLLDRIAAVVADAGKGRFKRIDVVKFLAPLLPDEDAELKVSCDGVRVMFQIHRNGTPILKGTGELE